MQQMSVQVPSNAVQYQWKYEKRYDVTYTFRLAAS